MAIVAFDAKRFLRGKVEEVERNGKLAREYRGFQSQLGVGVQFKDADSFLKRYLAMSKQLQESFRLPLFMPFYSSNQLKELIGMDRAIAFADQLITDVQARIESVHFSYAILPPTEIREVNVGGLKSPVESVPTRTFLENLGPMFSYLTAYSFLWSRRFAVSGLEFYIDSFRSKFTEAWDAVTKATNPKIFFRGDECNPFISCADLIAFLTDVKLYGKHLSLYHKDISYAWEDYSFEKSFYYFDKKDLGTITWKTNSQIDVRNYIARPAVYLMVDDIEKPEYDTQDYLLEVGVQSEIKQPSKPRKFRQVIKKSDVYYAALRYAYSINGSMKIFQRNEDMDMVRDNDVLVYVGDVSRRVAAAFKDAYDVRIHSGLEIRKKVKDL